MGTGFNGNLYHGFLIRGDLIGAMKYLRQFPEKEELYRRYLSVFEGEAYLDYAGDRVIDQILKEYQRYYRDVFYLKIPPQGAEEKLRRSFLAFFGMEGQDLPLEKMEREAVAGVFRDRGFYFKCGRTSGYCGPYIWRTEERKTYRVELPGGMQEYTIKLLDGFFSRSWLAYLSFGETGTGGWTEDDGTINCVRSTYDLQSEKFKVSLLQHEAQHAADLSHYAGISPEDLEYRAKLVELIYSQEQNPLERFVQEADTAHGGNSHALAANRIAEGFAGKTGKPWGKIAALPVKERQSIARELFEESDRQVRERYPLG